MLEGVEQLEAPRPREHRGEPCAGCVTCTCDYAPRGDDSGLCGFCGGTPVLTAARAHEDPHPGHDASPEERRVLTNLIDDWFRRLPEAEASRAEIFAAADRLREDLAAVDQALVGHAWAQARSTLGAVVGWPQHDRLTAAEMVRILRDLQESSREAGTVLDRLPTLPGMSGHAALSSCALEELFGVVALLAARAVNSRERGFVTPWLVGRAVLRVVAAATLAEPDDALEAALRWRVGDPFAGLRWADHERARSPVSTVGVRHAAIADALIAAEAWNRGGPLDGGITRIGVARGRAALQGAWLLAANPERRRLLRSTFVRELPVEVIVAEVEAVSRRAAESAGVPW
ncbi:Hypothetical protein CAP_1301 [Chondromyces apiculatus DSM 436]|uniref:Uncharacterized protein n=1 Tax=Chondromyces apiculatus DSM 436 TaxID=1192034 RepID=A0A017TDT8_9BACT|nr:Hypothetical protein CAP_1301 [Chondromyces apiculatus DSM 436]